MSQTTTIARLRVTNIVISVHGHAPIPEKISAPSVYRLLLDACMQSGCNSEGLWLARRVAPNLAPRMPANPQAVQHVSRAIIAAHKLKREQQQHHPVEDSGPALPSPRQRTDRQLHPVFRVTTQSTPVVNGSPVVESTQSTQIRQTDSKKIIRFDRQN